MGVAPGLIDKRAVGDRIIKRKHLFEMRSRRRKLPGKQQVSTGAVMTQHHAGGIVALAAQPQQVLVQALRQIEFAAERVMAGLPIGNVKELRGRTQLLP